MKTPATPPDAGAARPVFILGAARSGTSAVAGALRVGAGLPGHHEGHVLSLFGAFLEAIDRHWKMLGSVAGDPYSLVSLVDPEYIRDNCRRLFAGIYAKHYDGHVWVDKTPDAPMVRTAPHLLDIWPGARFVFVKRRGIENIVSRLKKFPELPFESHCHLWRNTMEAWLAVRDRLGGRMMEIEQRELSRDPARPSMELAAFLELGSGTGEAMARHLSSTRYESTGGREDTPAVDLGKTGWSREERGLFTEICGPVSAACGYSDTTTYYLDPGPLRGAGLE